MFVREALAAPSAVGAIAPSSPTLARALAAPAQTADRPLDVLEVGAGTGSATRALLAVLPPGSRLDVVECNPRFAAHLRRLLDQARHVDGRVHTTTIEDHSPAHRYDGIVSALPLTNFTPEVVDAITEKYTAMLGADGWLTYFAYLGTYPLRRLVANSAQAERHRAVQTLLEEFQFRHRSRQTRVWANLPPAVVTELRMTPARLSTISGSCLLPGSVADPAR